MWQAQQAMLMFSVQHSALSSHRERTPQMSEPNQPAAMVGFCFFYISLDSQSYRISIYKLWKVQESLNKQGKGGPGPRACGCPGSSPSHSTGLGLPPAACPSGGQACG